MEAEAGGRGPKSTNAGAARSWKSKETDPPLEPPEGSQPVDLFETPDLGNHKRMLFVFKSLVCENSNNSDGKLIRTACAAGNA